MGNLVFGRCRKRYCPRDWEESRGVVSGTVTKVEVRGCCCRTNEVDIYVAPRNVTYDGDTGSGSFTVRHFSIDKDAVKGENTKELVEQLTNSVGRYVSVEYYNPHTCVHCYDECCCAFRDCCPCRGETSNYIVRVMTSTSSKKNE